VRRNSPVNSLFRFVLRGIAVIHVSSRAWESFRAELRWQERFPVFFPVSRREKGSLVTAERQPPWESQSKRFESASAQLIP
jgi:hypothetical protein